MFRSMAKTAPVLVASLLFAGLAMAQTGAFQGRVTGADGKPLVGALVKIQRTDMKGNYPVKTNKKGEYYYMGLPSGGAYKISVYPSGKEEGEPADFRNVARLSMGDPVPVDFDLHDQAVRSAAVRKAAESGQGLTQDLAREMTPEQRALLEKTMKAKAGEFAKSKALNEAFNTAMGALNNKDYPAAIEGFKKAAEIDPKQSVIYGNLAESYVGLSKTQTGAEKDASLQSAVDAYQKALEVKPDDASLHNNLALQLANMKKVPESRAELEKAAALDPPNAGKYYYNLGAILTNTNQKDAAMEAFKKAIDLDPNYADAYFQYGTTLSEKMQITDGKVVPPPGMKEALEKYLALKPDGKDADAAKGLLQVIGASMQVVYENPDAKKKKSTKK